MERSFDEHRLKRHAEEIFRAALRAVDPRAAVRAKVGLEEGRLRVEEMELDLASLEQVYVVGAGKASAAMAQAVEAILGDRITRGVVSVKVGHGVPLEYVAVREASHPVPDDAGCRAAKEILDLVSEAGPKDLVIVLLSGGGSALLPLPVEGVSLEDKQETTRVLLGCGATIHEINTIRKHLSRVKGGRLAAAAAPARVLSLIVSDVIGDDLDVIASGPTVPDSSTFGDCLEIVERYGIRSSLPGAVLDHLEAGAAGRVPETPKRSDPCFRNVRNVIVAGNRAAVEAGAEAAADLGYRSLILSTMVDGEAREVARVLAAVAKEVRKHRRPSEPPACILAGGETTVTLRGKGKGGRNQELALAAALSLDGWKGVGLLSGGTDGTDGPTDAAGAWVDGTTLPRARESGLDARRHLAENNAYPFFARLDDLLVTGPTLTNVMDLQLIMVA